jgi:hypothetical protein
MKEFVLDCSATIPWVFASEATPEADALLDDLAAGGKAWAPALWHLELGNVLLHAQRKGRIDKAGIEKLLSALDVYDMEVDTETITVAWSKTLAPAESFRLSVPPTWSWHCDGDCRWQTTEPMRVSAKWLLLVFSKQCHR